MFQNIFSSSPLVWIGLIGAMAMLPPLIHLINLMRHRRIKWAAMDFLLKSHKRNRNWIRLKQLLLLASRMAILLLALFLMGQIGCENDRLSTLLGGKTVHHYVLLDDSFSMGDHEGDRSAFERALETMVTISGRTRDRSNQRFTILRTSQAAFPREVRADGSTAMESAITFDLENHLVDSEFPRLLDGIKSRLECSWLSVNPEAGFQCIQRLVDSREEENSIVYFLSDFRESQWNDAEGTTGELERLSESGAGIELIRCADTVNRNLAITEIVPVSNVRAVETPLMMSIGIKNFGTGNARNVQIKLRTAEYESADKDVSPLNVRSTLEELPAIFVDNIKAGESVIRRFPVYVQSAGQHAIIAEIPDDCVQADNKAWCITRFQPAAKTLLIDNLESKSNFFSLALNPGGMTGIASEVRPKEFLRDCSEESLKEFDVVFLLDVDAIDDLVIDKLQSFVNGGGGLCIFLGSKTNPTFFNEKLYSNGNGLSALPITQPVELAEIDRPGIVDVSPSDHPVFSALAKTNNAFLDLVQISKFYIPPDSWLLDVAAANSREGNQESSGVTVIANIRNNTDWPLIVEKQIGLGRTVVVTTSADNHWNNWMRNPTFPPFLLFLENYLAEGRYKDVERKVGSTLSENPDANSFLPKATATFPAGSDRNSMDLLMDQSGNRFVANLSMSTDDVFNTGQPGVYEFWLTNRNSEQVVHRHALNVDTSESEMAIVSTPRLRAQVDFATSKIVLWNQFNAEPTQSSGNALANMLLLALVVILLLEQCLAYSASYHPNRRPQHSFAQR